MRALCGALVVLIAGCDGMADLEPMPDAGAGADAGLSSLLPGDSGDAGSTDVEDGGSGGGATTKDAGEDEGHTVDAGARDAGEHDVDAGHVTVDAGHTAIDAGSNSPSLCSGSSFVLCDGFEGAQYNHSLWPDSDLDTSGNSITTDTKHVMRGERSLKIHLAPGNGDDTAQLYEKSSFPKLKDTLYGRVFIYLEADPPAHNISLVTGHQLSPHQGTYGDNINVTAWYAVQWNQSPSTDLGVSSATKIKLNEWICLEWMYSGVNGETRTWVDGNELTDMHTTGWVPVSFQQFDLGMYEPHGELIAPGGFDTWFDELALDTAPIGCSH